jgi:hypothetical protein
MFWRLCLQTGFARRSNGSYTASNFIFYGLSASPYAIYSLSNLDLTETLDLTDTVFHLFPTLVAFMPGLRNLDMQASLQPCSVSPQ